MLSDMTSYTYLAATGVTTNKGFIMIELMTQITRTHSEWALYGPIENFLDYNDFIKALKEAQEGDNIEIKINSPGGRLDVGMMIIQAMKTTAATVVCNVVYPSHSMGAIVALAGDYVVLQKHSYLMFHTYSGGTCGKSGDLLQDVQNTDEALKGMMDELIYPFLSKKEITQMHKGEDIYIKYNDPTLESRVKKHFKGTEVL